MGKNKYSVEESENTYNSSKQGSDGELFVTRVSSTDVVLKFKTRKNGTFPSSSNVLTDELTFSEKGNASIPLEHIEANCDQTMWVQSLEIRNAEPRDNKPKKIFDSYHALGGHRSIHSKPKKTHQLVNTASNSSGSGELQNLKFVCCKCNERVLIGQSLGGHKRKH
jgi:hypothetical protein